MGNSNSQNGRSPARATSLNSATRKEPRVVKRMQKQATPGPRLLPQPVPEGTRLLRSTDNGHILQSGGTISGRRPRSLHGDDDDDSADLLRVLQRRRSLLDNDETGRLSGSRKAHSDPDIVRSVLAEDGVDDYDDDDDDDDDSVGPTGRSIIAESPSKAKIRSKKKAKAPEPPFGADSSTLSRDENMPNGDGREEPKKVSSKYRSRRPESKSPAPSPPGRGPEGIPPPPPPPPDYNSDETDMSKNVSGYEKNRRPVEKWKLSKGETKPEESGSRGRASDRHSSEGSSSNSAHFIPNGDLQEELRAATKRRAFQTRNGHDDKSKEVKPSPKSTPKKQYYFSNIEALKLKSTTPETKVIKKGDKDHAKDATPQRVGKDRPSLPIDSLDDHSQGNSKVIEYILNDTGRAPVSLKSTEELPLPEEHVDHFERRRYSRSPLRGWRRGDANHRQDRWSLEDLSGRGSSSAKSTLSSESDVDINLNVQLRPTLPRKQVDIPRFSPTDAWRALHGSDSGQERSVGRLRSETSTDDGDVFEEHIQRLNRAVAPRRVLTDRCGDSGISPDAGSPILVRGDPLEHVFNGEISRRQDGVGCVSPPVNGHADHWIPKEDLMDDSDSGSVDQNLSGLHSYEPSTRVSQPKFTMPANMFMNWGTPTSTMQTVELSERSGRQRERRRKDKDTPENSNSLRNIRRALGLRARDASDGMDGQNGIDANWSLSKSAPNSLNVVGDMDVMPVRQHATKPPKAPKLQGERNPNRSQWQDQDSAAKADARRTSSFSFPREGHVMYLPKYEAVQLESDVAPTSPPQGKQKNKFSYMSTVRKEERRLLQEKLAREVAEKEKLREKEIRWMNRVEEEFRKQRDREKVSIRQQLRLLNMESKKDPSQEAGFSSSDLLDSPSEDNKMISNWILRGSSSDQPDRRNFSPPRPEPEGGRSSGDECKENQRPSLEDQLKTTEVPRKNIYEHLSRVFQKDRRQDSEPAPASRNDRRSLSPASQENRRAARNRSSSPVQRRSSSCDNRRTERQMSVFKKNDSSLERGGSGRTFQSHVDDLYSVPQKKRSVPKQEKQQSYPAEGRYRQLNDEDNLNSNGVASRVNGNSKESPPLPRRVNGSANASGKRLLHAQPFSPKKEYRRVPFRMAQQGKPNR
uniref:Putative pre-mrna-splicing factor cwc22 n=1 Tax=Ornithodoros turicata TaxID=34597 RepID=A0A2R5LEE8_9ACAR